METETTNNESFRVAEEPKQMPTVTAKKHQQAEAPPVGKDEQNAAEIARLSAWATGDCGKPILAD